MTFIVRALVKLGILKNDLDYHLLRASIILFFFGYQKWFDYEAQALVLFAVSVYLLDRTSSELRSPRRQHLCRTLHVSRIPPRLL